MTSLCHGTLASASALALQGVALALALAWPWECSDGLGLGCSGLGLGLGVCGLVNIPGKDTHAHTDQFIDGVSDGLYKVFKLRPLVNTEVQQCWHLVAGTADECRTAAVINDETTHQNNYTYNCSDQQPYQIGF